MCKCTPIIRTPFCGKPGCESPGQVTSKEQLPGPKQPPRIHGEGCICGDSPRNSCPVKYRKAPAPASKYPFYGHDDGLDITQPESGKFVERPMTPAELAARDPALAIAKDIYRHANYAGVCYAELWGLIAKAMQELLDERPAVEPTATHASLIGHLATVRQCIAVGDAYRRDIALKAIEDGLRSALPPDAGRVPKFKIGDRVEYGHFDGVVEAIDNEPKYRVRIARSMDFVWPESDLQLAPTQGASNG